MRLKRFEKMASSGLGTPILIAACVADCVADCGAEPFNAAERRQLARFENAARRRDWRLGRLALKSVLRSMGRPDDTSDIRFPNPQLSLTHGHEAAFAAGTPSTTSGVGVDFEALRAVNPRMSRWFLNVSEIDWFERCTPDGRDEALIRLWTVKEAVFKCHPDNRGLTLKDFTLDDPSSGYGCAVRSTDGHRFRCVSSAVARGFISVAVRGGDNEN